MRCVYKIEHKNCGNFVRVKFTQHELSGYLKDTNQYAQSICDSCVHLIFPDLPHKSYADFCNIAQRLNHTRKQNNLYNLDKTAFINTKIDHNTKKNIENDNSIDNNIVGIEGFITDDSQTKDSSVGLTYRQQYYRNNKEKYHQYYVRRRAISGDTSKIVAAQSNCCALCKTDITYHKQFSKTNSNNVIAAVVCYNCHSILSHAHNDKQLLLEAAKLIDLLGR